MSCNCKSKKPNLNNLNNVDYINAAKEIYRELVTEKEGELTDLEKSVILQTYKSLYPNSTALPSVEDSIEQIRVAINLYGLKHTKYKK